MKLLLDQNLSRRLLRELEPRFPRSVHTQLLGLERASDLEVWAYARDNGFALVSKDADMVELALLRGVPPKIVWLNCGNVSNAVVREKLLANAAAIEAFLGSIDAVLEIE